MKQIYLFIIALFLFQESFAICQYPLSYRDFGLLRQQLLQTSNPSRAFQMSMDMARNNCFTSSQVEDLATLLANDRDRLDFCKIAFNNTVDKENFEDVYDAFISFSSVMRLYRFINNTPQPAQVIITQPNINPNPYNPPTQTTTTTITYNYPNVQQYNGAFGCNGFINDMTFRQLKQQVLMSGNELAMFNVARNIVKSYCLCVAQVMELASLFNNENMRYDIVSDAFPNVYDVENYTFCGQLFNNQPTRDRCMNKIQYRKPVLQNPNVVLPPPTPTCAPTPNEFASMKQSITSISFNSSRESQLKSVVRGRCFNVGQIMELLNIFSYESSKLELSKFLFDFCNEKQNYYKVTEVFSFSSSKDELNRFIQGK